MSLQGRQLYTRAIIAGSFGFVTFGWDAGVLGGVLLTPEFQNAIGVSTDVRERVLKAYCVIEPDRCVPHSYGHICVPACIMAWMYDHHSLWHEAWT